jgi:amidase
MGSFHEYADHDGLGLAELVRRGGGTADEVLEAAFETVRRVNPRLNAVVALMREQAEESVARGLPEGPFVGVPVVLKDEYQSYAGFPTGCASRLCEGFTLPYDTEIVRRYKRAGLNIIGKANLPELGASVTTEPVLHGPARNPWDPGRTAGGSSGGSAAAVAAGMVPVAYGNDGAGSLRIPSSCCGTFGLKPTRARVPSGPDAGELWNGLVIEHAITRSVRDSAALLDATEGADPGAPYWAPPKERPFLEEVGADPGRLRIAFSDRTPSGVEVHPDCSEAMMAAARLCEELGHEVEEGAPEFDGVAMEAAITKLMSADLAAGIQEIENATGRKATPENVEHCNLLIAERGRELKAVELLGALQLFTDLSRKVVAPFFERYDVLLTPTLASPPVPHGTITPTLPDPDEYLERFFAFIPFTPIANVSGNPAMSVPLHWNSEGLPIGAHFVGRFGGEATLLRLAAQLEEARPWAHRRPPIGAWKG